MSIEWLPADRKKSRKGNYQVWLWPVLSVTIIEIYGHSDVLPFALRFRRIFLPCLEATLAKNPCFLFLLRRDGWNVLLINNIPADASSICCSPIVVMVGVVVVAVMPVRCCSLRMSKTVMGLFSERQMALSQVLFKVPLELKIDQSQIGSHTTC